MITSNLSVSELAQMTGLAIDQTWDCSTSITPGACVRVWCAPESSASVLASVPASSLPAGGAVRVESRSGCASWDAEWPLSFDLHWLREVTPGFPLGVRPVRVLPPQPIRQAVSLHGNFVTLVWRELTGQTRVQVGSNRACGTPAFTLEITEPATPELPNVMDEVMRSLTGSTSIEWLRGVFADSCSMRWKELASRIGARPDQLDDLSVCFRGMTTTEEDAIWRAAASLGEFFELQPWVDSLIAMGVNSFEDLLSQELHSKGPVFWRGTPGEWLNSLAGGPMECLTSPENMARLVDPARRLLSLLIRKDLAALLVELHAAADEEWVALAPWFRSRIEESCGRLSADLSSDDVMNEVSLWIKKLHQRLHLKALEGARQLTHKALCAAMASPASPPVLNGVETILLIDLAIASSPAGDEVVNQILGGDLRPCFGKSTVLPCELELRGGRLNETRGRRVAIEVLMPFFQKKSWTTARESLATAEINSDGGKLTVSGAGGSENWSVAQENAALLLSAVVTSRTEAPGDDMIHMVHLYRRTLQGNEADVAWLRVVRAYGLSMPELQARPCDVTLRMEIPWNWAAAWCHAPLKREAGYLDKFMQLSLSMQEMARHWLPALYLSSPQQFEAPNLVFPLLVYAASQPYADHRKAEYGYDAMSPFQVERAAGSGVERLSILLEPLFQSLKASGRIRTAELYSPDRARLIIAAVLRKPRALAALFAGDTFFLEHCFQLATISHELRAVAGRNPAQALRKLTQASNEIVKTGLRGLKRHYPNPAYQSLAALYLLEATRVLAAGEAGSGLRASLTIETGTQMQHFEKAA